MSAIVPRRMQGYMRVRRRKKVDDESCCGSDSAYARARSIVTARMSVGVEDLCGESARIGE